VFPVMRSQKLNTTRHDCPLTKCPRIIPTFSKVEIYCLVLPFWGLGVMNLEKGLVLVDSLPQYGMAVSTRYI
jgi:hypothetical protein